MPTLESRRSLPARVWLALAAVLVALASPLSAQVPSGLPQQIPSPEQAQSLLKAQPELVEQLRDRLSRSGLTPDQVRSRLRAAGYTQFLRLPPQHVSRQVPTAAERLGTSFAEQPFS